jgi:hypothetical protein
MVFSKTTQTKKRCTATRKTARVNADVDEWALAEITKAGAYPYEGEIVTVHLDQRTLRTTGK